MVGGREPRRKLTGSRFRTCPLVVSFFLMGSLLAACINHYRLSTWPLPVSEGWVQLPAARWLTNPGVAANGIAFCPREACGEQALVAELELSGAEAKVADLIARDPAAFLAMAKPTQAARPSARRQPRPARTVKPLAIGRWRGGVVRIESAGDPARAAHVVVLSLSDGVKARLLMTVAEAEQTAEQTARRILE